jgi:hypothetical protein
MDRVEAEKALALLRTVVRQARDDSALQRWGVIWMLHAFTNAGGFVATNLLLVHGVERRLVYAAMWTAIVLVNIASIFVLRRRRTGAATFIETMLWSIWLTFIGAVILLALVNELMGMPLFGLGPVIGILSAMGFAMMGAVMGRRWYLGTLLFAVASLAMAAVPRWQFALLGAVWGVGQLGAGIWLEAERRRQREAPARAHLV